MNDELILIENKIYEVRGTKVMLDFDLAELYGIETRTLKQAVRRNIERFPEDFMFMLTREEANNLIHIGVSQNVISPEYNVGSTNIFAFTEKAYQCFHLFCVARLPFKSTSIQCEHLRGCANLFLHAKKAVFP